MFTVRDSDAAKIRRAAAVFKRVREEMGIKLPENSNNVRYTGLQSRVHGGQTHTNPLDFSIESPVDGNAAAFGHKPEHMQREA
jgi:hypothetical protein